tara:strand:+ start:811 stop:3177 length:2367 start_codon:yes stop_codon:yes gene_type:complete
MKLVYFFASMLVVMSAVSHAESDYPQCSGIEGADRVGGCVYSPQRFSKYLFKEEYGSMHVRHYPAKSNHEGLNSDTVPRFERILFLVAPFSNPYSELLNQSSDQRFELDDTDLIDTLSLLVDPDILASNMTKEGIQLAINTTLEMIRKSGTDVIVFSFPGAMSGDYLQRKSLVLSSYLKELHDYRFDVFDESLSMKFETIIGYSLGGVIARAALGDLEKIDSNFIEYYVSYDSPHKGANIPVGLQYVANSIPEMLKGGIEDNDNSLTRLSKLLDESGISDITDLLFNWTPGQYWSDWKSGMGEANTSVAMMAEINSPAIKQLLINSMSADGGRHPEFYDLQRYLDDVGWPEASINISISNSIGLNKGAYGRRIDAGPISDAMERGYENFHDSVSLAYFRTKRQSNEIEGQYTVWASPVTERTKYYSKGWIVEFDYTDMGVPRVRKDRERSGDFRSFMPIDGAVCSFSSISSELGQILNDDTKAFGERWGGCQSDGNTDINSCLVRGSYIPRISKTCFIPASSSLGISSDYSSIDVGPYDPLSPFDVVYTANQLEAHLHISRRNYQILRAIVEGDLDEDGLAHFDELARGTSPLLFDTDGDGVSDAQDSEVEIPSNRIVIGYPRIRPDIPYTTRNRIWASDINANQFCKASGYKRALDWDSGCGSDEDTFSEYVGGRWSERDSGSKDRCYAIIGSVTCEIDVSVQILNPAKTINGLRMGVWSSHQNAVAYCNSIGYPALDFYTETCGNDEDIYAAYIRVAGEDDEVWRGVNSGSSNDLCYPIISGISCR